MQPHSLSFDWVSGWVVDVMTGGTDDSCNGLPLKTNAARCACVWSYVQVSRRRSKYIMLWNDLASQ